MTLKDKVPSFLVVLAMAAPVVVGCDAKGNSVSATASATGSSSGGDGSGGDGSTGGDVTGGGPGDGGSQTGPGMQTTGVTPPAPGQCEQTPTVIGLDDDNVTDETAQAIVDRVTGIYTGSMVWTTEGVAPYNGEPGPAPLQTITLAWQDGEVRSVVGELQQPCDHEGPCPCPSLLEIDAVLRITSDGGVLDETFAVTIEHGEGNGLDDATTTRIYFPFDPDDTAGTLSRGSFDLVGDTSITEMVLTIDLHEGAMFGSLNVEAEMLGGVGFGPVANFAAVTDDERACALLPGGQACTLAGCVEAQGTPVFGTAPNECSCSEPESYCFAEELAGDAAVTRYTREVDDGFDIYDEVVEFGVSTDLGEPWRACADAPEVDLCGCEGSC